MAEAMRTCPACHTRVLPTADGTCPACRRYNFSNPTAEVPPATALRSGGAADLTLYEAGVLYWRLVALVALQVVLAVVAWWSRRLWQRPTGAAMADRGAALEMVSILMTVVGGLVFYSSYRLAAWLKYRAPFLWAAGMMIPLVGLVMLLILAKEAVSEFEQHGLRVRGLGPRLSEIPRDSASLPR